MDLCGKPFRDFSQEKLAQDSRCAAALISEGYVKVGRAQITLDVPIAKEDEPHVQVTDPRLAKAPLGYWKFKDIQQAWGLFKPAVDALCFGLNEGELEFLHENKVSMTLVVMPNEPAWKLKQMDKNIVVVKGNPLHEDLNKALEPRAFNLLIVALDTSAFNIYNIVGRYLRLLMPPGNILVRMATGRGPTSMGAGPNPSGPDGGAGSAAAIEEARATSERFARALGLKIIDFTKPRRSRFEIWGWLRKI